MIVMESGPPPGPALFYYLNDCGRRDVELKLE